MSDYCSKRLAALSLDEGNKGFVGLIQANPAAYYSPAPPPTPPPAPTLFPDPTLKDAPSSSPLCHYCWKGLAALSLDEGNKGFVGSIEAPPPPLVCLCDRRLSVYDYDAAGGEGTPPDEEGEEVKLFPCHVCHEEMLIIEIGLQCGHKFHLDCLKPSLDAGNCCPSCRYKLQPGDAEYERKKVVAENEERRRRRRRRRRKKARKGQEKKHFHALETTIRKKEPTGISKRKNTRFIIMD